MAIKWSKSLSTGIDWLDEQHRELFNRISRLLDAISLGVGRDEVLRLFSFLDEYFVGHFHAEEEAMHRVNYPEMVKHLEEHTRFIDDISRLREEAMEKGVTQGLVLQVQRRVVDWLTNHIMSIDKGFAAFVREGGKEGAKKK